MQESAVILNVMVLFHLERWKSLASPSRKSFPFN
jgi:hypothetical protein